MSQKAGQVAVVTGAGRGMGRAIARTLARDGVRIVAVSRNGEELRETASRLGGGSAAISPRPTDVSDPQQVERLFAWIDETYGRLDLLVCSHASTREALARWTCRWSNGTAP